MSKQLEDRLIECLDALESGEQIDDILARYPEDAADLRSMLAISEALPSLPAPVSPVAKGRSERAFLAVAASMQTDIKEPQDRRKLFSFNVPVLQLVAVILIVFGFASILFISARSALPGDTLYGAKRGVESLQLLFGSSPDLAVRFNERRITEVRQLLETGLEADVSFTGPINSMGTEEWIIAGLSITLLPQTTITGVPAVDAQAQVDGHVQDGRLFADGINVGEHNLLRPTEAATLETQEAKPSATLTPDERIVESSPSPTPTAAATVEPSPTIPPTPTIVPVEDSGGDEPAVTPDDDNGSEHDEPVVTPDDGNSSSKHNDDDAKPEDAGDSKDGGEEAGEKESDD